MPRVNHDRIVVEILGKILERHTEATEVGSRKGRINRTTCHERIASEQRITQEKAAASRCVTRGTDNGEFNRAEAKIPCAGIKVRSKGRSCDRTPMASCKAMQVSRGEDTSVGGADPQRQAGCLRQCCCRPDMIEMSMRRNEPRDLQRTHSERIENLSGLCTRIDDNGTANRRHGVAIRTPRATRDSLHGRSQYLPTPTHFAPHLG